jgi:hypothetical protein
VPFLNASLHAVEKVVQRQQLAWNLVARRSEIDIEEPDSASMIEESDVHLLKGVESNSVSSIATSSLAKREDSVGE